MSDVTAARKTVTVLFSDLVESTSLAERLDPEALARLLDTYFREMRAIIEAHGGTVEKFIGDAVVGVFGVPHVHEDDAARAIGAALAMQEAVSRLGEGSLRARIGINTGEVVVTSVGDSLALGHAMNMAARLQQAAEAGAVLIGGRTRALVEGSFVLEDAGSLDVKGSAEPVAAARVVGRRDVSPRGWTGESVFVGRERELAHVLDAIDEARQAQTCVTVTVLAPPGMGKSRLAAEIGRRVGDSVHFLVGRCLPYGEGITYAPLVDIVNSLVATNGTDAVRDIMTGESDADLVSSVLELTASGASQSSPDETAWAFRRLLETLATQKAVVVVLDDIHWADPLFLDLVEYIATFSVGAPLTLIGLARPDLLDSRPNMLTPRAHSILVRLEPLADHEMAALLASSEVIDDATRQRITETSGGVPLFAEQMAAFQSEGHADVPPTVRALLAARVDRLEDPDRELLEVASVEGETFARATVAALSHEGARATLGGRLISLVQRDFVRPERSTDGRDAFRFSHALVRDAVYERMPRSLRSDLHERYASLLTATRNGDAPLDVVGHHLATAHSEMLALGDGEKARALALRAGKALRDAGAQAAARKQWQRAADLLGRAWDLLAAEPATRATVAPDLITTYAGLADFASRDAVHDEALRDAQTAGDMTTQLKIEMAAATTDAGRSIPGSSDRMREIGDAAIQHFTTTGDDWNLADAWITRAFAIGTGDLPQMIAALRQAKVYADATGNESAQIVLWDELGGLMIAGDTPYSEIREFMLGEIAWAEERGIAFTAADGLLGVAYCMYAAAEIAEARETLARVRDIFDGLPGDVPQRGEVYQVSGNFERDAGDSEAALGYLEQSRSLFDAMGNLSWWYGSSNGLAHALLDLGKWDRAAAVLDEIEKRTPILTSRRIQGSELAARSRLALGRGELDQALDLARRAVDVVSGSGSLWSEGHIRERLADALFASGHHDEGRSELEVALRLYATKGVVIRQRLVIERLSSLG